MSEQIDRNDEETMVEADEGFEEQEEFDEDEGPVSREVDGPAQYSPREKGGRVQRIGSDIRPEDIDYRNVPLLSRFLDTRGRLLSRRKTRVSAKVQRRVEVAIKRARHLALLPYTGDQTRIVRKRR